MHMSAATEGCSQDLLGRPAHPFLKSLTCWNVGFQLVRKTLSKILVWKLQSLTRIIQSVRISIVFLSFHVIIFCRLCVLDTDFDTQTHTHTDECAHIRLCEEALFECRQHCGNQASYERVKGICERLQFSEKLMRRLDQECTIPIRVS